MSVSDVSRVREMGKDLECDSQVQHINMLTVTIKGSYCALHIFTVFILFCISLLLISTPCLPLLQSFPWHVYTLIQYAFSFFLSFLHWPQHTCRAWEQAFFCTEMSPCLDKMQETLVAGGTTEEQMDYCVFREQAGRHVLVLLSRLNKKTKFH